MTVSASTPKFYRDYAVTLRQAAMDVVDQENRVHVRSCADNCDNLAASFENAATEAALQTCRQAGTVMNEIDTWRTADSLVRQFGDWRAKLVLFMLISSSQRTTTLASRYGHVSDGR